MGLVGDSGVLIHSAIRATTLPPITTNGLPEKHSRASTGGPKHPALSFRCSIVQRDVLKTTTPPVSVYMSETPAAPPGSLTAEIMLGRVHHFLQGLKDSQTSSEIDPTVKIL